MIMVMITVDDIVKATGGKLLSKNTESFDGVSINSRTASEGDVFFAIRGERFDGHDFLEDALSRCSGAVVDVGPEFLPQGKVIIHVSDTLISLQDLAHFLRMKRDIPVIAVTGSNGKTTTKEMIYTIVSGKFRTLKNEGNLNNHIGLPLSLTRLQSNEELIVLEMGMNAAGEIRRLCEIAAPSHGVITNIGMAHIGRLGSYEAIRDAKLEILEGLSVAVVNADDNKLMKGVDLKDFKGRVITFAADADANVTARNIRATESGSSFRLALQDGDSAQVNLNVPGIFNIYNALAASAVCVSLGMTVSEITAALEQYSAIPMRFEIVRKKGITVINDAYNANPSSVEEAIKELMHMGGSGRTVAVLGDMQELDAFSESAHRETGRVAFELGLDVLVTVGDMMSLAADEFARGKDNDGTYKNYAFKDSDEAFANIMNILKKGDTVLIKGSRAMTMEKVIEGISDAV
jgi:UDP-N-acetylmuramoyl-tripeptide--D-alanyl-D-alanine ligase